MKSPLTITILLLSLSLHACVNISQPSDRASSLQERSQFKLKRAFLARCYGTKNITADKHLIDCMQAARRVLPRDQTAYLDVIRKHAITVDYLWHGKLPSSTPAAHRSIVLSEMMVCWEYNQQDADLLQRMQQCFVDLPDGELGYLGRVWILWALNSEQVSADTFQSIILNKKDHWKAFFASEQDFSQHYTDLFQQMPPSAF